MSLRVNSYFSGAGLMEIGLRRAGVVLQQSFEIDPTCVETHSAVRPEVIRSMTDSSSSPCEVRKMSFVAPSTCESCRLTSSNA